MKLANVFITSDHHFGQESFYRNNPKYGHTLRPEFKCAEEADNEMVRRHNAVVPEHDSIVYFLGDVAKNITSAEKYISQMNGTVKILVMGNHDAKYPTFRLQNLFDKLLGCTYILDRKYILSHIPIHPSELRNNINIHGHVHRNTINDNHYLNACQEVNDYTPIHLK